MTGTGAAPGIGIGHILLLRETDLSFTPHRVEDTAAELERYRAAVADFRTDTTARAEALRRTAGDTEADILLGHILMIEDPYMTGEIEKQITGGDCAETAVDAVCATFIAVFSAADDELTNQRAADVRDIRDALLRRLLGVEETDLAAAPPGTVLAARELTPSLTASMPVGNIVGIVTQTGGRTSHSAILARALGIPAVVGLEGLTEAVNDGDPVIVDGGEGVVLVRPTAQETAAYTQKRDAYLAERAALRQYAGKPTATADGARVELFANIGAPGDAVKAAEADAEGIGLFRTEVLYMDRTALPDEEEQFRAYQQAALTLKGKPVIIRTLDIGGDKDIPYLGLAKEENPFLGWRAVRFCLAREDIFRVQLRALLRASAFGDVRILVPLVTGVDELRRVKTLLAEEQQGLTQQGVDTNRHIAVGVMVETPAAVMVADQLAKEAAFFSIGTNDLTQYTLAVDRGNPQVSCLYSPYHPAVLRAIRHTIDCARAASIPAGMCGEAAADPLLIPLLIAFGLDEFSVSPTAVLATRRTIAQWNRADAAALAAQVMALDTEEAVRRLLIDACR